MLDVFVRLCDGVADDVIIYSYITRSSNFARPDPEEMNRGNEDVSCELMND